MDAPDKPGRPPQLAPTKAMGERLGRRSRVTDLFPVPYIASAADYEAIRAILVHEETPAYEIWLQRQEEAAQHWAT